MMEAPGSAGRATGRPWRLHIVIARLNIGGPAIHVSLLASRIGPGFAPVIVTGEVGPHEGDMTYFARDHGIEPVVLPGLGRELRPLTDLTLLFRLFRIFRTERPDVVHTHTAKAGTLGRLAAWLAGVPVVVHTFHGHVFKGYFGGFKTRFFLWIERVLARVTDRIITLGELQRREILELGVGTPESVVVVPLGLDLEPLTRLPSRPGKLHAKLGLAPGTPLVGIVARLVPIKGHRTFLQAARRLADRRADVTFVIVGDGELRAELEQTVEGMGLAGRVRFVGWVKDLAEVYPDLSCLALSSINEGLPTTVLEAQACGVPVVATRVGSVPDMIDDGRTGILVEPGDDAGLAGAIERVLVDHESSRKMGEAARLSVGRFGTGRLVADLEALYGGLLAGKGIA